eukprot:3009874-Prymnesium_polylepis.2
MPRDARHGDVRSCDRRSPVTLARRPAWQPAGAVEVEAKRDVVQPQRVVDGHLGEGVGGPSARLVQRVRLHAARRAAATQRGGCLLYTSDAADDM